jgi:hypothetical protein
MKRLFEMLDEKEDLPSVSQSSDTQKTEDGTTFKPPSIAEMRQLPEGLFDLVEALRALPKSEAQKADFLADLVDIRTELDTLSPAMRQDRLKNNVAFSFFPSSASLRARVLLFRRLVVPLNPSSTGSTSGTDLQFAYSFGDLLNSRIENRTSDSPLCFDLADTMQWKFEPGNLSSSSISTSDLAKMKYPQIFHLFHSKVSMATYGSKDFEQKLKAKVSLRLLRRAAAESSSNTTSTSGTNVTWRSATHKAYLDLGRKNQEDNKSDEISTSDTAKVQLLASSGVLTQEQKKNAAQILANTVGNNFIANHSPVYGLAIAGLITTVLVLVIFGLIFKNYKTIKRPWMTNNYFLGVMFLVATILNIIALVLFLDGDFTYQNKGTMGIVISNFVLWSILLRLLVLISDKKKKKIRDSGKKQKKARTKKKQRNI